MIQPLHFILQTTYSFRKHIFTSMIAMVFYSVEVVLRPYLIGRLINSIHSDINGTVSFVAFLLLLSQILFYVSKRFYEWCLLKYEAGLKNHVVEVAVNYLAKHDYSFFQHNPSGKIVSKINDISLAIPLLITTSINGYLVSFLSIVAGICMLWYVYAPLALAFSVWVIFILITSTALFNKFCHLTKDIAESTSNITGNIADLMDNILGLKLFSTKKYEILRLKNIQNAYFTKNQKYKGLVFKFYLAQGMSFIIYQAVCLFILTQLHHSQKITAGMFVMVLIINLRVLDNLWLLSDQMRTFSESWGTVAQAFTTIFSPQKIQDSFGASSLCVRKGEIVFKDVTFHYTDNDNLFRNLSVKISAGQKTGIVGHSGSGKTTFVNLILRLFDTTEGTILIDSQNIKNVTQDSLSCCISIIPQNPLFFHRTIMENIRYARLDASDEEVFKAAKQAQIHDFIIGLPEKYKTLIGEKGLKLSGGQRQKLAICRAFLKNAPILILDESTSQLDSISEAHIQESLWRLMEGKTTIVIAHRLSTVTQMDRLLVFDQGQIIQDGRHADLVNTGLYRRLWETQVATSERGVAV